MPAAEIIPSVVRLAIAFWPADAPRGAVTAFCAEYGISRKSFYALRGRAVREGPNAVLAPRSRRPKSSSVASPPEVIERAVQVRAALAAAGLDHGPLSVFDRMRDLGMDPPSRATLARHFRARGVVQPAPTKRPRSSYRRFVYPAPNSLWQIDATEYRLTRGSKCVIFQVIDDHSRLAVASHVAWAETSRAAIDVVQKGIILHGAPQRLLSDNGVALNPSRRGVRGKLVAYLESLGVEPITGRPGRPTTQGKNERFHQTLFRWLDRQPFAETLDELQTQVDAFDQIYNTERHHQALAGRITPLQAWTATPKAASPAPPIPEQLREGSATRVLDKHGAITVLSTRFRIGKAHAGASVYIQWNLQTVAVYDERGTELRTFPRPPHGTRYVGNGQPAGFMAARQVSPKS